MKNILISLGLILLPLCINAQSKAVKQFYEKYKALEKVSTVQLQGWLLKMAAKYTNKADGERILQNISHLRVLVMSEGNLVSPAEYKQLVRDIRADSFEKLLQVKEKGQDIEFLIREKDNTITDVLMLMQDEDQFILLSLEGVLKLKDLKSIEFDIDGGSHFKKLPDRKGQPRA